MRITIRTSLLASFTAIIGCATTAQQAESASLPPIASSSQRFEPRVELWLTGGDIVRRGDDIGVRFRTSDDGYAVVGRIDTDGRIDILYPRRPDDDARAWRGEYQEVRRYGDRAFTVDDRPGIGYVFAIVSPHRLRLSAFSRGGDWDYHGFPDVEGDPFIAMHHFAEQVVYDEDDDYSMDYAEYHVDGRYDYPRFACYDCHHGRPGWDVYSHPCVRYHIVIYDDPEYYPYRHGGGRRVVYSRPRYEFKPVSNDHPAGKIEYGRRTSDDVVDRRRPGTPTEDPNVPPPDRRGGGNDGATRPGDDIGSGTRDPRDDRRGGQNGGGVIDSHRERPVRDSSASGNGNGNGPGTGDGNDHGNGNGDDHGNGNGDDHGNERQQRQQRQRPPSSAGDRRRQRRREQRERRERQRLRDGEQRPSAVGAGERAED